MIQRGPNSKAVWVGGTRTAGQNRPVRFCLTAIANPHPSLTVTSMDWFTCRSQTAARHHCDDDWTVGTNEMRRNLELELASKER